MGKLKTREKGGTRMDRLRRLSGQTALVAAAIGLLPIFGFGQEISTEYEWDPQWGLHEEEWYDPSDWFNDDNITDIEDTYDDDYYATDFWDYDDYVYEYGYDYDDFVTEDVEYYYQWDPVLGVWSQVEATEEASRTAASNAKQRQSQESQAEDQREQQVATAEQVVTMRGTVSHVARITPEGGDQQHTFVRLDVNRDSPVLVDVGPAVDVSEMEITKGDQIQVRGPRAKFDERFVLVAQQISRAPQQDQQYGGRPPADQGQKQMEEDQEKEEKTKPEATEEPESSDSNM